VELHVRLEGKRDLARQVYRAVRAAILDGSLRRGERLPATRELARRLGISRNTVALAYDWLVAEGLVSGRRGAGSFVEGDPVARAPRRSGVELPARAVWRDVAAPSAEALRATVDGDEAPAYDFGVGVPDVSRFPFDAWRRLLARQLRRSAMGPQYGDPKGLLRLRAAIARYIAVARGVKAAPEEVVVTHGAQGAFDLVARLLLEPGARVAVEEPGYPRLRLLLASYGARVVPIPVDAAGLDANALPADVRLVYVTPSHQFPLGMAMSHGRRVALLAWAERRDAVILEDDYDSEFRFGGRPLETLQAMDRLGRVVYVGSFSKSLLPALRLGFLVAPASLGRPVRAAAWVAGCDAPPAAQAALAALLESGQFARHVRRMRRAYAARHERILRTLEDDFAAWLEPLPSAAGVHLAARLRSGDVRVEGKLAALAGEAGVRFDRLSPYCAGAPQAGLVLGYGAIPEASIPEGLRRLRKCCAEAAREGR
jgi:GntR family transcriptional regulator/MocR family aminotransferase